MRICAKVSLSLFVSGCLPVLAHAQVESGFVPVYTLNIPQGAAYDGATVPYTVDNSAAIPDGSFSRVAYLLTLGGSTNPDSPNGFVYVSFDTFTHSAANIGVPNNVTYNAPIQQFLSNMNVVSNVPGVVNGTGLSTGNIEFWNSNYDQGNSLPVPNADSNTFDFGDHPDPGGYGSMQIHNYGAQQTLLAYNNWGNNAGGNSDLGIGNSPVGGNPDWTFRGNAGDYAVRTLEVFVNPEPASLSLMGCSSLVLLARRRRTE